MVIRTRMPVPDAWRDARCLQLTITPYNDPVYDKTQQDDMVAFCNEPAPCPIRHTCLLFALVNNCADGVWGGMSPEDRRAMRRRYPLEPGERDSSGVLTYHPRPEWHWLPPGHALTLLTTEELAQMDAEDAWHDED